jgi:pimeloyl-ACP methyl ester carboxylesterase
MAASAEQDGGAPPGVGDDVRRRTVRHGGIDLAVLDAGEGFPVVLAHGFPELAYSWRHQIPALAAAGCRVLAPDQRGYGRSTRPEAVDDYDIAHLTGDLLALLDDVGEDRGVFVGHDWGALVVWQLALLAPERVAGVVGMSVPFVPRPPLPPTQLLRQVVGDSFFYILYFQEPGVADADLGRDPAATMTRMLAGLRLVDGAAPDPSLMAADDGRGFVDRLPQPGGLPEWLSRDALDHYIAEFTRTGFTGGLNWYRNFDRNWETTAELDGAKISVPCLFIGGTADPVLSFTRTDRAADAISGPYQQVMIDGAGHWLQQERPDEVNAALLEFLNGLELQ